MRTIEHWLEIYGDSHRNPINKLIHRIAVPIIAIDILGLLAAVPVAGPLPGVSLLAHLAVVAAVLYYARLSPALAIGMALLAAPALVGLGMLHGALAGWFAPALVGVFVLAWIAQFIGHALEGARPSFFEDLQFLLIGPLWLLADLYRRVGLPYAPRRAWA